jgi:hypothetical protein
VINQPNHVLFSRLAALAEGRLCSGEQIEIRAHLVDCPDCAAQFAWLERVIGLMRTDRAEQPPAPVLSAVKRLFHTPIQATRAQLIATLQFDSARTPAAARRAGVQTERQMLFVVSSYLLDVRVVQHGPLWVVSGQLLGTEDGRQVELEGSAGTAQAMLNDLSEFALPASPPGIYTLRFQLTDFDITIDGLEVGQ